MGIQSVTVPDARAAQRKFSDEDGSAALDLVLGAQAASDGEAYKTQSGARSAGQSLQAAIERAVERRGGGATVPGTSIRVWKDGDAHRFAVTSKDNPPASVNDGAPDEDGADGGDQAPAAESQSRADLDARAEAAGLDPSEYGNKSDLAEAINTAEGQE